MATTLPRRPGRAREAGRSDVRVEGRHTLAADARDGVWNLLYDPATFQNILPGVESFEAISAHEFRIVLRLRIGQIVNHFTGTLWLDGVTPLTGFDFQADGESGSGLIHGRGGDFIWKTPRLTTPPSATRSTSEVDGPLQSANDRVLTTTARAFARRALEALERQLALRTRVYTTVVPPPALDLATRTTEARLGAARRLAAMLGILLFVVLLQRVLAQRPAPPASAPLALIDPLPASGDEPAP